LGSALGVKCGNSPESVQAAISAIEIYNKPNFLYRKKHSRF